MKRLLSIDGGGIKGMFPAAFLGCVEEAVGTPIARYFDLVVGTSTGGIIALAIGLGIPAADIVRFYEEAGPRVFAGNRLARLLRSLFVARYPAAPLRSALETVFQERRLGESSVRLVIPSMNVETGTVHIFKTAHHEHFERDFRDRVVDVAMATAAAPAYFPAHELDTGVPLVDGGVWANNPVGMAVVEAIGVLKWPAESLRVLSLGCTMHPLAVRRAMGFGYWAIKASELFMVGQSSASLGTAAVLVGHPNVTRISPVMPGGRFKLDGVKAVRALRGLGTSEARTALPRLREQFLAVPTEPFVPFRTL